MSFKERTDVTAVPGHGRGGRGDDRAGPGRRGPAQVRRRLPRASSSATRGLRRQVADQASATPAAVAGAEPCALNWDAGEALADRDRPGPVAPRPRGAGRDDGRRARPRSGASLAERLGSPLRRHRRARRGRAPVATVAEIFADRRRGRRSGALEAEVLDDALASADARGDRRRRRRRARRRPTARLLRGAGTVVWLRAAGPRARRSRGRRRPTDRCWPTTPRAPWPAWPSGREALYDAEVADAASSTATRPVEASVAEVLASWPAPAPRGGGA